MKTLKHKAVVTILTAAILMTSLLPAGNTAEFRLWETGHTHVIAYVKLTKT